MTPLEKRFWAKVEKKSPGACWEWRGAKNADGYGRFKVAGLRVENASRASYRINVGDVPDDMCVCHHCDNPGCVNPSHLFLATFQENMKDRDRKGRGWDRSGEHHPNAKLNWKAVREIRDRLSGGASVESLANEYRVSDSAINHVKHGRSWKE